MDSESRSHAGFQQWDGMGSPVNAVNGLIHAANELWPSKEQREQSDAALRDYKNKFDEAKKHCKCKKNK